MRTVIVTGGSRGLGLGIVRALASRDYRVVALARRPSPDLEAINGDVHFHACDLAQTETLAALVRTLKAEFGAPYALVNNAGLGTAGVLATMPDADIEQLVRLNLVAPMLLTKYVARAMMAGGGSRIVNIGSIVGSTGYSGLAVYSATKAGLAGFTRALARELGPLGITVNTVAPGFVATEMTSEMDADQRARIARRSALRRLAETTDVAACVAFLLDDAARNITGTVLTVDAGNTA